MANYYWYKPCPACHGQGRLIIYEDVTHGRLYLHCEECEWGWLDPESADDPGAGFLTLSAEFASALPDADRIASYGWSKYALHSFDE
jgi:hypothetical protein